MEELSDAYITEQVQRRSLARESTCFQEADDIYRNLLKHGVLIIDSKDAPSTWIRFPILQSGITCWCWSRRRQEFCCKQVHDSNAYFCTEHKDAHSGRVPCPLDPKHSIALSKLSGHLPYCQRKTVEMQRALVWEPKPSRPRCVEAKCLDDLSELAELVLKVLWDLGALELVCDADVEVIDDLSLLTDVCFRHERPPWVQSGVRLHQHPVEVPSPAPCQRILDATASNQSLKSCARNGFRHAVQYASIAGHLDQQGWLGVERVGDKARSDLCLLEFGAGTAQLSNFLKDVSSERIGFHVLVDRQAVRNAADHKLGMPKQTDCGKHAEDLHVPPPAVERIQCDICNFDAHGMLSCKRPNHCQGPLPVVGVAKHLCGAATDHSMRCMVDMGEAACKSADSDKGVEIRGLACALCCHHLCDWSSYVGKDFLISHGITEEDFHAMCWFSHFSTKYEVTTVETAGARLAAGRAQLGHLSKRLLNEGRLAWLHANGWTGRLTQFTERKTSPENVLLLAWPTLAS